MMPILKIFTFFIVCLLICAPAYAQAELHPITPKITGVAHIIDGDSLRIQKNEIRLHGIDAPEYEQHCYDMNGHKWSCGITATKELQKHLRNTQITCQQIQIDQYQRILAECKITDTGENINAWLVKQGWAIAYKRYTQKYTAEENHAKKQSLGIWRGYFLRPEKWRYYNKGKAKLDK